MHFKRTGIKDAKLQTGSTRVRVITSTSKLLLDQTEVMLW